MQNYIYSCLCSGWWIFLMFDLFPGIWRNIKYTVASLEEEQQTKTSHMKNIFAYMHIDAIPTACADTITSYREAQSKDACSLPCCLSCLHVKLVHEHGAAEGVTHQSLEKYIIIPIQHCLERKSSLIFSWTFCNQKYFLVLTWWSNKIILYLLAC